MVQLIIESWIWYGICVGIVICRLTSRWLHYKSLKKFQWDDWLVLVALASHTAFIVTINIVSNYASNLIEPGENISSFSPKERADRIFGSKLTVVVEQLQCLTIWLLKACLLLLYDRVTKGLRINKLIHGLAVYVAISYVVMELLYFLVWCHPFSQYWALPTYSPQCNTARNHLITYAVFNITSDLVLLIAAFFLFLRNHLHWTRKIILSGIFGLGMFSILSAVLNKYYSFTHLYGAEWTYWYVRESSTTLIVANMPFCWPLIRRVFAVKSFDGDSASSDEPVLQYHSARSAHGRKISRASANKEHEHHRKDSRLSSGTTQAQHHPSFSMAGSTNQHRISGTTADLSNANMWRKHSIYGRGDADALGDDDEDEDETHASRPHDEEAAAESRNRSISAPTPTQWTPNYRHSQSDAGSMISRPQTAYTNHAAHVRDIGAQLSMQQSIEPTYHDFLAVINDRASDRTSFVSARSGADERP